jgi:uncharacterized repeat protein (TIGR03803 family)
MKSVYRAVALILALTGFAWVSLCMADNSTTIYQFKGGDDGTWPYAGLLEYQGEFYGTTWKGGSSGGWGPEAAGTIFKLTPPAKGQSAWTKTVLHNFIGNLYGIDGNVDGAYPMAALISGNDGKFYGTTNGGGQWGYGAVFQLVPPANSGDEWTVNTIYSFCSVHNCDDGTYPVGSLLLGADGALYGTTSEGGGYAGAGDGTVFKLTRSDTYPYWTQTVIYYFCSVGDSCLDGYHPKAELIADKDGVLYGTTEYGGDNASGTVFKLTPPAAGGGLWTETVLHSFCSHYFLYQCIDGAYPTSGLVFDTQGNLYGTTTAGGACTDPEYNPCSGTVFKLTRPGNSTTDWTQSVTHSFTSGRSGYNPVAALIVDSQNNLYGTTQLGGSADTIYGSGLGTVFKLGPSHWDGTHRTLTVLTNFINGDDPITNSKPAGAVTLYQGALYGTTAYGGPGGPAECVNVEVSETGCGSIFKVSLGADAPHDQTRPSDRR